MRHPDQLNGPHRFQKLLLNSTFARLLATTGCSPALHSKETACSTQTIIDGKNPAITLKRPKKFTARAYDINPEGDARVLIALEPGVLNSGLGPNQLNESQSNRDIDLALIIDASMLPPAIGIRYSFRGQNGDRTFATLATEAVGYQYDRCNFVEVRITDNYPSLTVNNGRRVVPALPM